MNEKNSVELIATFPEMFHDLDPRSPMAMFHFECGDGWFGLLKDCFEEIKEISTKKNFPVKCFQIKEKFGTLRFYTNGYDCCIGDIIEKAEQRSASTCEECGEPGVIRDQNKWYSTQCDKCWYEYCARYSNEDK